MPLLIAGEGSTAGSGRTTRVLSLTDFEQQFVFDRAARRPRRFAAARLLGAGDSRLLLERRRAGAPAGPRQRPLQPLGSRATPGQPPDPGSRRRHLGRPPAYWPQTFVEAAARLLEHAADDPAFAAEALTLPGEATLAEEMALVDPSALHEARNGLRRFVAEQLGSTLLQVYATHATSGPYQATPAAAGRRALRNVCLSYLGELNNDESRALAMRQFESADNMTDQFAALATLAQDDCPERVRALASFYERWHDEALVVDKWLSVQAASRLPDTLAVVKGAARAPGLRSAQSKQGLRAAQHLRQQPRPFSRRRRQRLPLPRRTQIGELDRLNPQVAARLTHAASIAGGSSTSRASNRPASPSKSCVRSTACRPTSARSSGARWISKPANTIPPRRKANAQRSGKNGSTCGNWPDSA
jgi:hypothetical protein